MHGYSKYIALVSLFTLLFAGCSTRKNTSATRAYHELTTRYNVYFNAEDAYFDALNSLTENYIDNYHELLLVYPNSSVLGDTVVKQPGGPFDRVIEKTAKAIEEHSITAKPRRDPSRSQTQEYRDWLRQNEFNPFIDQAWLLMGKAHVQNKDYTEAISVLSQTARLFNYDIDVVSEAQIWMMRAYAEMGWFSDAESLASMLQIRKLPKKLHENFIEAYTFLLLRQENYRSVIPFLQQTINQEKSANQKRRLQFLLGQIYTRLGERDNAYQAFERIKGLGTPYDVSFNALMAQAQVADGGQIIENLLKMAKSKKNEEYLDQIYAAAGNIYLSRNNIEKAIESYSLAEKKSVRNGIDKALAQVALGDIYFERKEFIKAEPRYSEALGILPKTNENYDKVAFRADALKELVPHLVAVGEQDSLRRLAQLPKNEQLKIINAHIDELKKREREKERDAYLSQQQSRAANLDAPQSSAAQSAVALANRGTETRFYFYNPQLVAQGRSEFQRRWGNRKLEDNWRLQSSAIQQEVGLPSTSPSLSPDSTVSQPTTLVTDLYSAEYYLQRLPVSPEAIAASDGIIDKGLYEGGKVAKDRLEDFDFATGLFERQLSDFPNSEHRKDVYYQLYLINLRLGNRTLANGYKSKILSEFPESEYAVSMSSPDYEYVMQNFARAQDSLYQQTYRAYQQGRAEEVHRNFETAEKLFLNGDLMPKFRLLHALSFAQKGDAEQLETSLRELAEKHPDSEESKLGQNILDGLSEGKMLAANASALSGINWQTTKTDADSDTITFSNEKSGVHSYLLLFPANPTRRNELLFAVSDFNFSNFQIRTFNTTHIRVSPYEALQIKPFRSFDEAHRYHSMLAVDSVFKQNIPFDILPLIISDENLELVNTRKSLAKYFAFMQSETLDSIKSIAPIIDIETVSEPEKVVPLEPEKAEVPVFVPQQPERRTIEEREAELERKAEEALRQAEKSISPKDRERMLKDREKARKEALKQRERELKQREKARKEELKQRERERREKLKEQERIRKEKLKERQRNR